MQSQKELAWLCLLFELDTEISSAPQPKDQVRMIKKAGFAKPPAELPGETVQAQRFEKARSAQASAVLEDYVELIDDLLATEGEARPTDIARRLGVTHATAIKTITRLKREGLATSKLYRGVFLTPEGRGLAERVRTRHRLVVDLLRAVGVPEQCAELDAEGIEHHVSDTALDAFARFLRRQNASS